MSANPFNYQDTMHISLADDTVTNGSSVFTITSGTPAPAITTSTGIYTTNGTSASPYNYNYNWASGTDTITLGDYANIIPSTLDVKGDANFEGDVKIKGKSLVESLEKIEEKLAILRPNEKLEAKWDRLRELRKQYMELEAELIEKEKMWDILKK